MEIPTDAAMREVVRYLYEWNNRNNTSNTTLYPTYIDGSRLELSIPANSRQTLLFIVKGVHPIVEQPATVRVLNQSITGGLEIEATNIFIEPANSQIKLVMTIKNNTSDAIIPRIYIILMYCTLLLAELG